jgi:hypothetical protein
MVLFDQEYLEDWNEPKATPVHSFQENRWGSLLTGMRSGDDCSEHWNKVDPVLARKNL